MRATYVDHLGRKWTMDVEESGLFVEDEGDARIAKLEKDVASLKAEVRALREAKDREERKPPMVPQGTQPQPWWRPLPPCWTGTYTVTHTCRDAKD